jgi:hypothetical protein
MSEKNTLGKIERLEWLAAWHRINAEHAGADWVWEARLRTAEDLERRAEKLRAQLSPGESIKARIVSLQMRERGAPGDSSENVCSPTKIGA